MSFLDILLINESDASNAPKELFYLLIMDVLSDLYTKYLPSHLLFYTDYQDFQVLMLNNSPELLLALNDYFDTYFGKTAVNLLPSAVFDVFNDSMVSNFSQFIEYVTLFIVFF